MRILALLLSKIWQNRWLTASTLLGLTVAASFAMSIPMYADGTLKRVAASALEGKTQGLPAGSLYMKYQTSVMDDRDVEGLAEADAWIRGELRERIGFPVETFSARFGLSPSTVRPVAANTGSQSRLVRMELAAQSGLPENIRIVAGRMPRDGYQDGLLETIVPDETLSRYDWRIGDAFYYDAKDRDGDKQRLTVQIVGAYQWQEDANLSGSVDGKDKLAETFWISESTMMDTLLVSGGMSLDSAGWFYAFDLREIRIRDLSPLIGELQRLEISLHGMLPGTKVNLTFLDMLRDFARQSVQLQAMLFALAAPVLAMVVYFIALNASLSLVRQRGDIAVLQSRGAKPWQIAALHAMEAVLLGIAAMLAGLSLAWFMAKMIGSSSGFLNFVSRKSIPVGWTRSAVLFGLGATVLAVVASVAPIRAYARTSIVQMTRRRARAGKSPFWQRFYLDAALLAAAASGWYLLHTGRLSATVNSGGVAAIGPTIFVIPALMIFAAGLMILRVFPLLLRMWNALMKFRMPVTAYLTLTQLSRSAATFYPLMILLMLTIGLGVYNASAARTMDLNATDRTKYQYGSDVVLKAAWEGVQDEEDANKIYYTEPPFGAFDNLDGVRSATRVMKSTAKVEISGKSVGNGQIVGIDNSDFYRTAWFREDMYPYPPYQYLDAMGTAEQAVLVSETFASKYGLKAGDPLRMTIGYDNPAVDFIIVGIVPYWPSLYPDETPFFIAHLDYLYQQIEKIPYEVWIALETGAQLAPIVEELIERGIAVAQVDDARGKLIETRNHPAQGGVFGMLSLGFLISLLISLLGYLIFWFFTLSRRVAELGILRATGLTRRQLTGMLLLEQLFTTGLSVAAGIGLGTMASRLFLPFLQGGGESAARQVPPFRVVFDVQDMLGLYTATGIMLAAGACLLVLQLRRLRITQAVKLGEER